MTNYTFKPVEKTYLEVNLGKSKFKIDITSKTKYIKEISDMLNLLDKLSLKLKGKSKDEAQESFMNTFNRIINLIFTQEQITTLKQFYDDNEVDYMVNMTDFLSKGFIPALQEESKRVNKYNIQAL